MRPITWTTCKTFVLGGAILLACVAETGAHGPSTTALSLCSPPAGMVLEKGLIEEPAGQGGLGAHQCRD